MRVWLRFDFLLIDRSFSRLTHEQCLFIYGLHHLIDGLPLKVGGVVH